MENTLAENLRSLCLAFGLCVEKSARGLFCTRDANHEGDHVATGDGEVVLERWSGDA